MHPLGAQICGSKPAMAAEAAKIIEDLGFDCIDLNCGCPVDKVTKDGSGSGLLRKPELIGEILSKITAAVRIPVSVKIRSGWDEHHINAPAITRIAEEAGATAITVHGRTRKQAYQGRADWSVIRECKEAARQILVFGNGDIFDASSAERIFAETLCDGILLARGMLGRPWIVEDIYRRLSGEPPLCRTGRDVRTNLLSHFQLIMQVQPDRQAVLDMRRVGCWFLKNCCAKELKMGLNRAQTPQEVFHLLDAFDWDRLSKEIA